MRLAVPLKALAQRFALFLLVATAIALLVIGKADIALTERLRAVVIDAVSPLLSALSEPVAAVHRLVDTVDNVVYVHRENARLREENARLLHWQEVARRLEQDNAALRRHLSLTSETPFAFVSARVIGDSGGPFVRTVLVNAGSRDGLRKGQAALGDRGLVGRIVETGQRAARVLLITDLNSRVPVVVGAERHRAILAGDNSGRPQLEYLPTVAPVAVGDRIETSGEGGVFPAGLPVGVVGGVGDGLPRVEPFVDLDRLEFVRMLQFAAPTVRRGDPSIGASGE
jgi:rod shape-determining protein MreC